MIVGLDPGEHPGYAIRSIVEGHWWTSVRAPDLLGNGMAIRCIVTEDVWFAPRAKGAKRRASPMSIATLSNTCGRQSTRWGLDVPVYRLPVPIWKDKVLYNGAHLPKDIFVSHLRAHLKLSADLTEDEVEACGLVYAFELLGYEKGAAKWLQKIPA